MGTVNMKESPRLLLLVLVVMLPSFPNLAASLVTSLTWTLVEEGQLCLVVWEEHLLLTSWEEVWTSSWQEDLLIPVFQELRPTTSLVTYSAWAPAPPTRATFLPSKSGSRRTRARVWRYPEVGPSRTMS